MVINNCTGRVRHQILEWNTRRLSRNWIVQQHFAFQLYVTLQRLACDAFRWCVLILIGIKKYNNVNDDSNGKSTIVNCWWSCMCQIKCTIIEPSGQSYLLVDWATATQSLKLRHPIRQCLRVAPAGFLSTGPAYVFPSLNPHLAISSKFYPKNYFLCQFQRLLVHPLYWGRPWCQRPHSILVGRPSFVCTKWSLRLYSRYCADGRSTIQTKPMDFLEKHISHNLKSACTVLKCR
jgi:hypothetical protein